MFGQAIPLAYYALQGRANEEVFSLRRISLALLAATAAFLSSQHVSLPRLLANRTNRGPRQHGRGD
jgi:hypothetical protein